MKKYIKLFAVSSILVLGSCSDQFLDTEPYTEKVTTNFYKTPDEAYQGLVAVYDILQREAYGGPLLITEEASDNCFGGYGGSDATVDLEWDRFQFSSNLEMNNPTYQVSYQGIYRANILLENLGSVNWGADTALKTQYEAEARFLRAYFTFDLARMFGDIIALDHTIKATDNELPRNTPEQTYALIASDLKFAADNLGNENYSQPTNPKYGRITKWAAESYLAKAFLFYTDYYNKPDLAGVVTKAQAITYINDVVNNSGHALVPDFSQLWLASAVSSTSKVYGGEGNNEMVWAIRFNGSGNGNWDLHEGNRFQVDIAPRGGNIGNYATGWGGATVNPKLYNAYALGDTRRDATIIDFANENLDFNPVTRDQRQYTGYAWKKYCPITDAAGVAVTVANGGNFQIDNYEDFAVIRFSDVLLMAAELNLATNAGFAQACFNKVRERAFHDTTHNTAVTIPIIMKERQLEFALEGQRYFDLIRQDMATTKAAIDNTVGGSTFAVTFRTETQGWFPLPQSQILLANGAISQNPGW
ncbi:RagB/SusD family nutrient uptake outer membrane protein [Flavobacterium sp. N3904]|uniref:RagB/SusD family nutrient uptake outer membrane protein n=1 Tax=Flavobacterium sp. N3904 TaxID=2986835 RepID=UPI002224F744|nr:RagB/SusD family nutrient uptake outer membrane protein [Flavobacterium sp. N3904]